MAVGASVLGSVGPVGPVGAAASVRRAGLRVWRAAAWSSAAVAVLMPVDRSAFLFVLAVVAALGCSACVACLRGLLAGRAAHVAAAACLSLTVVLTAALATVR